MKKQALFMVVVLAAVGLLAGVAASNAFAKSGGEGDMPCGLSSCHGNLHTPAPVASLVSNDGSNATYSIQATAAFEWAVFKGTTLLGATHTGATGTFTVPVGSTYSIYAVYGDPKVLDDTGASTTVTPEGGTNYTITPTAGTNGTISPATAQTVASGNSATFTMTPATDYKVADILVDGVSKGADTTYTFTNVTANHTIAVSFEPVGGTTYTITPTTGANGTISPATEQTVAKGSDNPFTITPDTGYYIDTLKIDGTAVAPAKSYTFANVTKNHTIEATFAKTPAICTITSSVVGSVGGDISPDKPVWTMIAGSGITYEFVPHAGFHVDTVVVDGWPVAVDEDNTYTFSAIDRDHKVSVTFAPNKWTLAASATGKGSISPTGTQEVLEGTGVTYTFTPTAGNRISDVVVDGVSVGIPTSYTFDNVIEDHTILVKFVANTVNYTITPSVAGGVGGSILPVVPYTVTTGGSITFDFLPSPGYQVGTVTVDGAPVASTALNDGDSYTFANVTANHTIAVAFVPVPTFTITPTAGAHGAISPTTAQTVTSGDDASYTITPDAGYVVSDVLVDGKSVGAVTSYDFTNVTANHTIAASFAWVKLPTTIALKANVKKIKRNGYVTLTATLKGGTFTNTSIRFEVKKAGAKAYKLLKSVKVSSEGVAKYRYKVTAKGTRFHRVTFLGNDTYLPAPATPGIKLVVK